jgi:hypothetical protein
MFNILDSIYLQTTQIQQAIDVTMLAVMISSVTMTIFAITLWITWKTTKANTKASYSQLLRSFNEDLTKRLEKNAVLKTTEDCERYANDYLNNLDVIAFLTLNDKIPTEIGKYLHRFFGYSLIIIDWYDKMVSEDFGKIAKENWPNNFEFCKKYSIKKNPDDKLPKIMQDYNKLKEKEKQS